MAQEGKPTEPGSTDAPEDVAPPQQAGAAPPAPVSADTEKDRQVEAAKARVAAAKQAAGAAAPGAPKPPVKKKEEGPKPSDASGHPLVKKLKDQFGDAIIDASEFLGQLSVRIAPSQVVAVCDALRTDADTPFN